MAETPDIEQRLQPEQETPASPRPIRRGLLIAISVIAAAPVVGFLSKDWCCTTVGCTVLCAIVVAIGDRFFLAPLILKGRCTLKMQFLPMLVVLIVLVAFFARTPTRLFQRVFGMPPPTGVSDLAVDSALWGPGGGEENILMRFKADQATIERLVQHRGFVVDKETMTIWSEQMGKQWPWLWERAFSNFNIFGGRAWKDVEPMQDPVLFVNEHSEDITPVTVKMLWDRASGRTHLLYLD